MVTFIIDYWSPFNIITSANIQQLRWFQEKFYLIAKKWSDDWEINFNAEKSRKNFIKKIDNDVEGSALITSWLLELPNKRITVKLFVQSTLSSFAWNRKNLGCQENLMKI